MSVLATLRIALEAVTEQYERGMAGASATAQRLGGQISDVGKGLTAGITLPLLAAGAGATSMANDFNSGMANVISLNADAQEKIAGWGPQVQQIAIDVGKGTGDMTDGLYNVVSAFGVTDDSLLSLEINAKAGAAGLATTTDAINLTSAVTKAYGDTSADAQQKAADLALKTVQLGQTTFPELAASVGRVTPLTNELMVSQEELFATLATGTGVTGSAAEVSTQLRGILQSLMAPTGDMTALFADMGVESGQALIEQEGLQGAINAIVQASEDSGQPLQSYIGSIEGQTLALSLAGSQSDVFAEKLSAMQSAAGATDEAFNAQTEGVNQLGFMMQQNRVKMEVFGQRIGQILIPFVLEAGEAIEPLFALLERGVTYFQNLAPEQQRLAILFGVIAVAAGPVVWVIGQLITLGGAIAGVFAGIASPVLIAVGALVAAGALLYVAWQNDFGGIRDFVATVWTAIQDGFGAFALLFEGDFIGFATTILETWETAWGAVVEFLGNIWTLAEPKMVQFWTELKTWWSEIDWYQLGYDAMTTVLKIWEAFDTVVVPKLTEWFLDLQTWFSDQDWGAMGQRIIEGIVNALTNGGQTVADAMSSLADGAYAAFADFFDIQSPSRLMERAVGYIKQPLISGFNNSDDVAVAANNLAVSAMPKFASTGVGGGLSIGKDAVKIIIQGNADEATVQRGVQRGLRGALRARGGM